MNSQTPLPFEITPVEVKRRLDSGEPTFLLDVREPAEHVTAHIAGAQLVPMSYVPVSLQQIDTAADDALVVVFCHHGVRSLNVVNWLRQQGVESCQSMAGGIDRWSIEIDPSIARY